MNENNQVSEDTAAENAEENLVNQKMSADEQVVDDVVDHVVDIESLPTDKLLELKRLEKERLKEEIISEDNVPNEVSAEVAEVILNAEEADITPPIVVDYTLTENDVKAALLAVRKASGVQILFYVIPVIIAVLMVVNLVGYVKTGNGFDLLIVVVMAIFLVFTFFRNSSNDKAIAKRSCDGSKIILKITPLKIDVTRILTDTQFDVPLDGTCKLIKYDNKYLVQMPNRKSIIVPFENLSQKDVEKAKSYIENGTK